MGRVLIEDNSFYTLAIKEQEGKIEDALAISKMSVVGNIYWAKVINVRGDSYFIKYSEKSDNGILFSKKNHNNGDFVICCGVRDADENKGAIFKEEVTISKRFLVFCNNFTGLKFSHKLSEYKKNTLNKIVINSDYGFIVRRTAIRADNDLLEQEMSQLTAIYKEILANARGKKEKCLYQKTGFEKVLEEIDIEDCEIITSNKDFHQYNGVKVHSEILSLFDFYGLKEEFNNLFSRKISLPDGVEIVFDYTEAMTVIDINSCGAFGKNNNLINMSALEVVIKQIRLRNIGGIIFVDTINNKDAKNLIDFTNKLLEKDREKARATLIKEYDIVAINRQKRYNSLKALFYNKCNKCENGFEKSIIMICREMIADIRRLFSKNKSERIVLKVNEFIFEKIKESQNLKDLLKMPFKTSIFIKKDPDVADYAAHFTDDNDFINGTLNIQEDK
ncbi:MAG: ribonuclease E/G [Bacillota bacterium]